MSVDGIVEIFQRVLESEDISADTDFFTSGGDSLIATRVLSAIARRYGVELSFEDFIIDPTPAGLAAVIGAKTEVLTR